MPLTACPFCGSLTYGEISAPDGATSYAITAINKNTDPPTFIPSSGVPVVLKGCQTCKKVVIECPAL